MKNKHFFLFINRKSYWIFGAYGHFLPSIIIWWRSKIFVYFFKIFYPVTWMKTWMLCCHMPGMLSKSVLCHVCKTCSRISKSSYCSMTVQVSHEAYCHDSGEPGPDQTHCICTELYVHNNPKSPRNFLPWDSRLWLYFHQCTSIPLWNIFNKNTSVLLSESKTQTGIGN